MKKNIFCYSILLLCFLFLYSSNLNAQVEPSLRWEIIHIEGFDLIYDADNRDLAKLYAQRLSKLRSSLSLYFTEQPKKTIVVLNDRTDLTNGYATPIPYPLIMIFPVLPGPAESISEYDDWAWELLVHEYVHILTFEQRRSFIKYLTYFMGSLATPNILLPRWYLEGISVEMETRLSKKGRLRSTSQDASLRTYLISDDLDGKWSQLHIAEMNETNLETWPYGARPYLFGSFIWSEMVSMKGTQLIPRLNSIYGGRIPYFINGPIDDEFGMNYQGLFEQTKKQLGELGMAQLEHLNQIPFSETENLKLTDIESFAPAISPDGYKMAYIGKDDSNKRSIQLLIRTQLKENFSEKHKLKSSGGIKEELIAEPKTSFPLAFSKIWREDGPPSGSINRISWFPDSKSFVYDKLNETDRYHDQSDLFIYNLETKKADALTKMARAREPSVSSDGTQIAYVKILPGKTNLWLLDLKTKESKLIYETTLQERVSFPFFLNSNEILFSLRRLGQSELRKINIETKKTDILLTDFPELNYIKKDDKGFLFVSTKNGVSNLFHASKEFKEISPYSHVPTALATFDVDPINQDIYSSHLTTSGFQLHRILKSLKPLPNELPSVQALLANRYPKFEKTEDIALVETEAIKEAKEYSPWQYLIPGYWFPLIYSNGSETHYTFSTAGNDPLGKHSYSLFYDLNSYNGQSSYNLSYQNETSPVIIQTNLADLNYFYAYTNEEWRSQYFSMNFLQQLSQWNSELLSTDLYGNMGFNIEKRMDPKITLPADLNFHLGLNYSNYSKSGAQISPESGYGAFVDLSSYWPTDKSSSTVSYSKINFGGLKYISKFLPKHHVFMIRGQGLYTPSVLNTINYSYSSSSSYSSNGASTQYLIRGYPAGYFKGKNIANANLEYRLPLSLADSKTGTFPFYLRRIHGAVVIDGLQMEGMIYDVNKSLYIRQNPWRSYWSGGAELKADFTLGYQIQLTMYLGLYQPLSDPNGINEKQLMLGLNL